MALFLACKCTCSPHSDLQSSQQQVAAGIQPAEPRPSLKPANLLTRYPRAAGPTCCICQNSSEAPASPKTPRAAPCSILSRFFWRKSGRLQTLRCEITRSETWGGIHRTPIVASFFRGISARVGDHSCGNPPATHTREPACSAGLQPWSDGELSGKATWRRGRSFPCRWRQRCAGSAES